MKITKINLVNFRNYSNAEIHFNKKMNIFIGDNAQGKTNILESIGVFDKFEKEKVVSMYYKPFVSNLPLHFLPPAWKG